MTFLSPIFMFVFLPISLAIYALIPKYLKSYSIPLIGVIFFAAINLGSIFSIVAMPIIVIAIMTAIELYRKMRIRWLLNACRVICIVAIFAILSLRFVIGERGFFGVGIIMCLMAAVSLCADVLHGNGRVPDTAWDVVVYITFFPSVLAGPFITYGDFVEKLDRIDFGLENFSSGAIRFIIGVLKCVAISEVLGEAYDTILISVGGNMSLIMTLILASIYGVRIYYMFSGCSDMGRGLASMLGIRVEKDFRSSFKNATPCDYIRHFFSSLLNFCRAYIVKPVTEIFGGMFGKIMAAFFVSLLYAFLFSRSSEMVYLLIIPLFIAMLFIVIRTGKKRKGVNIFIRALGYIATFLTMSFFWWMIYIGAGDDMAVYFNSISNNNAFYISTYTLTLLGDIKYTLLPGVTAIGVWLISKMFSKTDKQLDQKQKQSSLDVKDGTAASSCEEGMTTVCLKYVAAVFLLLMLVFTVIILLPQYPSLSVNIFGFPFV